MSVEIHNEEIKPNQPLINKLICCLIVLQTAVLVMVIFLGLQIKQEIVRTRTNAYDMQSRMYDMQSRMSVEVQEIKELVDIITDQAVYGTEKIRVLDYNICKIIPNCSTGLFLTTDKPPADPRGPAWQRKQKNRIEVLPMPAPKHTLSDRGKTEKQTDKEPEPPYTVRNPLEYLGPSEEKRKVIHNF